MEPKHVVVIGGSVAGLGVALALSGRGHRVTVLEADATPLPASHDEAFASWQRRGSPQARHSHAFLGRLRNLIRDHAPTLLEKLLACGAEELRFADRLRQLFPDASVEPGDEDMAFLACRRITFEWVLRRHVQGTGLVTFEDGARVVGLDATPGAGNLPPTVTGVWCERAGGAPERVAGDLVVDASGRRSKLAHWLEAIGARAPREASSPCGIFYTTRFYQLRPGVEPPPLDGGIVGVDLGYLKVGIFAGDSRVFSITLAATPGDDAMRKVLHEPAFEVAVAAVPQAAQWVAPALSEPVSGVHGMANLNNTRRFFWEDGAPAALGVLPLGDALIHTNPIVGRGCSLAWTSAFALADCLGAAAGDPAALSRAYEAHVERDIVPWYELQVAQDADAIEVAEAQMRGDDPYRITNPDGSQNPKAFLRSLLRDGLVPALQEDVTLLRLFLRSLHLLDPPGALMKNPVVMQRLLASYAKRDERPVVVHGPTRGDMIERFAAAGA
jgi:2-polyprenyl-6-methoxyphenol hydroxylase-like FAD-dependent oxidoreductase